MLCEMGRGHGREGRRPKSWAESLLRFSLDDLLLELHLPFFDSTTFDMSTSSDDDGYSVGIPSPSVETGSPSDFFLPTRLRLARLSISENPPIEQTHAQTYFLPPQCRLRFAELVPPASSSPYSERPIWRYAFLDLFAWFLLGCST